MKRVAYEISDNHYRADVYSERFTTAQWKQILLDHRDRIIYKGCVCQLIAKKLGYGVVEVSKDLTKHPFFQENK